VPYLKKSTDVEANQSKDRQLGSRRAAAGARDQRRHCSLTSAKVRNGFTDGTVFATVIPMNVRLAEAPSYHKSIIEYDSECNGAKAYGKLTEEILSCLEA